MSRVGAAGGVSAALCFQRNQVGTVPAVTPVAAARADPARRDARDRQPSGSGELNPPVAVGRLFTYWCTSACQQRSYRAAMQPVTTKHPWE